MMRCCFGPAINKDQRRKSDENRLAVSLAQDATCRAAAEKEKRIARITAATLAATAAEREKSSVTTLEAEEETVSLENTTARTIR